MAGKASALQTRYSRIWVGGWFAWLITMTRIHGDTARIAMGAVGVLLGVALLWGMRHGKFPRRARDRASRSGRD